MKKNEFKSDAKVLLLVLDELYVRLRKVTGDEVIFGWDKEIFFIVKNQQFVIGNKKKIFNVECKDPNLEKVGKQINKFGLTYDRLQEMKIETCSFKDAVYRAGGWLGLPL